jgi:seryl-tRNA synthetase
MTKTRTDHKHRAAELSLALEIAKFQRDAYREQIAKLEERVAQADRRAERAEERLHATTLMISSIAHKAVSTPNRSTATEVLVDGKSILRLNNPINFAPIARAP